MLMTWVRLKTLSWNYHSQYYTKLFLTLVKNKTNAIETVRSNRKNMPKDFVKIKLQKGECKMRSCNRIVTLKWKDKRDVHIIFTKHETAEMTEQRESQFNPTLKPKCVSNYNKWIIAIDRHGQMLACLPIMRKYMKRYRKIFFYVFDMVFFNSIIFCIFYSIFCIFSSVFCTKK